MLLNALSWEVGKLTFCQENPAARQAKVAKWEGRDKLSGKECFVWILTATVTNLMAIHIFIGCAGFVNLHSHLQAVFFPTIFKRCLINLELELRKTLSGLCPSGSHNRRHYVFALSICSLHSCEQEGKALRFSSKLGKNFTIVLVREEGGGFVGGRSRSLWPHNSCLSHNSEILLITSCLSSWINLTDILYPEGSFHDIIMFCKHTFHTGDSSRTDRETVAMLGIWQIFYCWHWSARFII